MRLEELKVKLEEKFPGKISDWDEKNPRRIYFGVPPEEIRELSEYLYRDLKFRFIIASGIQTLKGFQILYHFSFDAGGLIVSARVRLSKEEPEVDSIADLVPAADWIEREIFELLGIRFRGRPDLEHLLLNEEWPKDVYPLRKDFKEEDVPPANDNTG